MRRKKIREDTGRRKKIKAGGEKVEKVAKRCVFPMFWGSGSKSSMLKRRVQSHLGRCEIKNCTPLWREARFEIKNCKNTPLFEAQLLKRCKALWRKTTFEVKMYKTDQFFERFWKLRCSKCTSLWRVKTHQVWIIFGRSAVYGVVA